MKGIEETNSYFLEDFYRFFQNPVNSWGEIVGTFLTKYDLTIHKLYYTHADFAVYPCKPAETTETVSLKATSRKKYNRYSQTINHHRLSDYTATLLQESCVKTTQEMRRQTNKTWEIKRCTNNRKTVRSHS